jgi:hypothetical protein
VKRVEPPALRVKSPPAPAPEELQNDFDFSPSSAKSKRGASWLGLWMGPGAGVFILVLVTIGATLWATGFLSNAKKGEQGNPQALKASQKDPKSNQERVPAGPETPESKPALQRPKEAPKQPQEEPRQKRPEEPYDLKGDRLGMSLQDFTTKYRHKVRGDPREAPFSSDQRDVVARQSDPLPTLGEEPWHPKANIVNARITFPFEDYQASSYTPTLAGVKTDFHLYRFVDERLYRIEYLFPHSGFSEIREAMVVTYGKPRDVTTKEYQNSFGAKFDGVICTWDNGTSRIILMERSLDLKTSLLTYIHHELDKLVESRRAQFRKPRL